MEVMIVVAVIGFLAAIAIPCVARARSTSHMNVCINNLRQIGSAEQQWALEKGKQNTAVPDSADIAPYMNRAGTVAGLSHCPIDPAKGFDSSYTINACNVAPTCQIQGAAGLGDFADYPHALPN